MSCMWGAPLHHWGNATREGITVHVSHTWGAPLHHWGNATREGITVHVSHTWAVREGLPSTIEEMLHVRALLCTWATRELYVRGSPPPLRKCYTWGHYRTREPHVRGSPPPLRKCYTWGHYCAREPHVSCTWGAPLHHWGNATREGITVHVSHTWAVREGLPSTIEEMLHVRALDVLDSAMFLCRHNQVQTSFRCHYVVINEVTPSWLCNFSPREVVFIPREVKIQQNQGRSLLCTWATRELYVRGSLHHWGNATCEGITVHVSHTWLTCMPQLPSTFQKKWPKNSPSTT